LPERIDKDRITSLNIEEDIPWRHTISLAKTFAIFLA